MSSDLIKRKVPCLLPACCKNLIGCELQVFKRRRIIHGDTDASAPLELTGRKTADAIPDSQLKVYENAAHGLFITHKERLNRDLLTFIQG
jgi:pimeloyl-ACP methyl ester carboxylesterase